MCFHDLSEQVSFQSCDRLQPGNETNIKQNSPRFIGFDPISKPCWFVFLYMSMIVNKIYYPWTEGKRTKNLEQQWLALLQQGNCTDDIGRRTVLRNKNNMAVFTYSLNSSNLVFCTVFLTSCDKWSESETFWWCWSYNRMTL